MRRLGNAVALVLFLMATIVASPVLAGVQLETSISDALATTTKVRLGVVNTGDENAIEIRPLVVFRGKEVEPDLVDLLVPGARYAWELDFPLADAAGAFPITAWIRYRDGYGEYFNVPIVHLVGTPGYGGDEVAIDLEATPIGDVGHVKVRLRNPSAAAVAGRLVVLLPDNLGIEPKSQPAEVPAGAETDVPLVLQNVSATEGSNYPIQVLFEYDAGGVHHTALGRVMVPVVAVDGGSVRPVVIGGISLLIALALLVFAWRRAANKRDATNRAERRRDGGTTA